MLLKCPKCDHAVSIDALKCLGCGSDDPKRRTYRAFKIVDRVSFTALCAFVLLAFLPVSMTSHKAALAALLSAAAVNVISRTLKQQWADSLWSDSQPGSRLNLQPGSYTDCQLGCESIVSVTASPTLSSVRQLLRGRHPRKLCVVHVQ